MSPNCCLYNPASNRYGVHERVYPPHWDVGPFFQEAALSWTKVRGRLALSNVRLFCCNNGTTWGRRISSLHLLAVELSSTTTSVDFNSIWDSFPHHNWSMPKPIPLYYAAVDEAFSMMSYTWCWPSARNRVKQALSVNKTCLHCLNGNILGVCAATQIIYQ